MDFGSMLCAPKDPPNAPVALSETSAREASGEPERFPTKNIKKKIPHIEAIAAVIQQNGKVLLKQRPPKGLLGGLMGIPKLEN